MNPYQSVHDKLRVWHLDCSTSLAKERQKDQKIKLAITSFCDKTLFKPTASASTGSGGPCNEHRQKAKSCVLNYEILILMFHCFTLTISRINTSNALCFSDTQWQKLWQWWGSKMSLNHVEPCWTLPLRNTTFDCLERPCSNTAPASATSAPGDASNSATCRKKESVWRIRRYCNAKTWHFAMTMHCINAYQAYHLFRVVFLNLFWWGWNSRHMVLDVLVLGHFETQSWLIPTRSFSNPLSPRLRLDHRFLCCLQRIKVRNGRQHPRSRRVLLRLILHLPALRLQFGQVSLLQRLAFAINHPPSQEPRVIPRACGDGESHAVHRRRRGWIHGSDSAGAMSTISWAKVSPGDWGQWWTMWWIWAHSRYSP